LGCCFRIIIRYQSPAPFFSFLACEKLIWSLPNKLLDEQFDVSLPAFVLIFPLIDVKTTFDARTIFLFAVRPCV